MKIALGIEYDGSQYHGWQRQTNLPTIQGHLETALTKIADEPIKLYCAGRTDAGVHASGQVVHFETQAQRNPRAWTVGTNTNLPPSISVRWAEAVDENFHARFSAISRCYHYVIYNHPLRSALLHNRVSWYPYPLAIEPMQTAAQYLIGELDFSSFRSAECDSNTPMRNVHKINITCNQDLITVEIQANAFLHHMVRNIVGVLLQIGTGRHPPDWMQQILLAKDRKSAAETAPASGLYLVKVNYPELYTFPQPLTLNIAT